MAKSKTVAKTKVTVAKVAKEKVVRVPSEKSLKIKAIRAEIKVFMTAKKAELAALTGPKVSKEDRAAAVAARKAEREAKAAEKATAALAKAKAKEEKLAARKAELLERIARLEKAAAHVSTDTLKKMGAAVSRKA